MRQAVISGLTTPCYLSTIATADKHKTPVWDGTSAFSVYLRDGRQQASDLICGQLRIFTCTLPVKVADIGLKATFTYQIRAKFTGDGAMEVNSLQ